MKISAPELNAISRAVALERERRKFKSLHEFTKGAWHVIEPGTEFIDNWHLKAIGEHLEQVSIGNIKLLIINIPPRHCKSISVSVTWCPWEWGPMAKPHVRFLHSSYAGSLSVRDSLKARRVIQSEWYRRLWGENFELVGDQNSKLRFENSVTGYRLATSVGGLGTGEGGDRVVVDDPHNVQEAESEAVRDSTVDWWSKTMSTRLNDARTGAHVIVMQRVHEKDVAGYELAEQAAAFKGKTGECVHLCLPARFEEKRRCVTYVKGAEFFRDPRKKEGDLLWEARFDDPHLKRLERKLGEYATAGQLQQLPAPAEGGLFKQKFLKKWPAKEKLPLFKFVVQSYDTAFTDKTQNDPTAHTAWGVFQRNGKICVMLLEAWDEHMQYAACRRKIVSEYRNALYGEDGCESRTDIVLVEEKGSGISIVQDLALARIPVVGYNPGRADKTARAQSALPYWEAGYFYAPESSKTPGEFASWVLPFLRELMYYPNAEHDDYVDTFSQLVRYLRDAGFLDLDPEEPEDEVDYNARKARPNPYGS